MVYRFLSLTAALLIVGGCKTLNEVTPVVVSSIEKGKVRPEEKRKIASIVVKDVLENIDKVERKAGENRAPKAKEVVSQKPREEERPSRIKESKFMSFDCGPIVAPYVVVSAFGQCLVFLEGEVPLKKAKRFYQLKDLTPGELTYVIKYMVIKRKDPEANDKLLYYLGRYDRYLFLGVKRDLLSSGIVPILPEKNVLLLPNDADFYQPYSEYRKLLARMLYKNSSGRILPISVKVVKNKEEKAEADSKVESFPVDSSDIHYNPKEEKRWPYKRTVNLEKVKP